MSLTYFCNEALTTNSQVFFRLKEQLKLVGWEVYASSNGSSFDLTTDIIASAADLGINSWYCIKSPPVKGISKHLCIQIGASLNFCRIKVSWTGFRNGSPSATVVPSAIDDKIIYGTGTDASPTFWVYCFATATSLNCNTIVGDADDDYFVCLFLTAASGGAANFIFFIDRIKDAHEKDIDPYYYYVYGNSTLPTTQLNNTTGCAWENSGTPYGFSWTKRSYTDEQFAYSFLTTYSNSSSSGSNSRMASTSGLASVSGLDKLLPVKVMSNKNTVTANALKTSCYKGELKHIFMSSGCESFTTLDSLDLKTKVYFGGLILPWDGSTPSK